MPQVPFDTWGRVAPSPAAGHIEMLKVAESPGGGYLLVTVERGHQYDMWFQSLDELIADLNNLDITWQSPDSTGQTPFN